jgi:hypothetical protein
MDQVHNVPDKLNVQWVPEVKAVLDTWTSYFITLPSFREAVLEKALSFAKDQGVRAWIVDSSKAKGAFSQEIQDFIGSDVFPAFAKAGVKYFVTITSTSALTNMTIGSYAAKLGPNGLKLVEATSAAAAIEWLKQNA